MRRFLALFKNWLYEWRVYRLVLANEIGRLAEFELQTTSQRHNAFFAVDTLGVLWRGRYLSGLCDDANRTRRRLVKALGLSIHTASTYDRTMLATNRTTAHLYSRLMRDLKARHLEP